VIILQIEFDIKSTQFTKLPLLSKIGVVIQCIGIIFLIISLTFQIKEIAVFSYSINSILFSVILLVKGYVLKLIFDKKKEIKTKFGLLRRM
jgi:hypothetical protein